VDIVLSPKSEKTTSSFKKIVKQGGPGKYTKTRAVCDMSETEEILAAEERFCIP
jgi:hypothetical protein